MKKIPGASAERSAFDEATIAELQAAMNAGRTSVPDATAQQPRRAAAPPQSRARERSRHEAPSAALDVMRSSAELRAMTPVGAGLLDRPGGTASKAVPYR